MPKLPEPVGLELGFEPRWFLFSSTTQKRPTERGVTGGPCEAGGCGGRDRSPAETLQGWEHNPALSLHPRPGFAQGSSFFPHGLAGGRGFSPNLPNGLCWAPLSYWPSPPWFLIPKGGREHGLGWPLQAVCRDGNRHGRGSPRRTWFSRRRPHGGLEGRLRLRANAFLLSVQSPPPNCRALKGSTTRGVFSVCLGWPPRTSQRSDGCQERRVESHSPVPSHAREQQC